MSEELEPIEQKEEKDVAVESKNLDGVEVTDFPEDADVQQIKEILSKLYAQVDEAVIEDILNHLRSRSPDQNSPLAEHIIYNVIHNIQMQELDQTLLQGDAENTKPSQPPLQKRSSSVSSATPTSLLRDNVVPNELMHEALTGKPPPKPVTEERLERLEQMSQGPPPLEANIPSVPDQNPPPSNSPSFVDALVAESNRQYEKEEKDREKQSVTTPSTIFKKEIPIPKNVMRELIVKKSGDDGGETILVDSEDPRVKGKPTDTIPEYIENSGPEPPEPPSQPEPLSTGVVAQPENVTTGGKKRRKKKSKKRKTKRRYKRGKRN